MKTIQTILALLAGLALAVSSLAADSSPAGSTNIPAAATVAPPKPNEAPPAANPAPPAANAAAAPAAPAPAVITSENGASGLRMNFHNAPLNLVLDYLVEAAGFIINKRVDVSGLVEISSSGPISRDEAVDLLNSVLKQNGYGITRKGRLLTIIRMETAKTDNLPIVQGNNPDDVEEGDEVVTQIIPVRYASVSQLTANLEVLLPSSATLSANESANTLILVATKTDIKRMLKIIDALDTSIASVSSIKVMPLKYADAKDTATLITQLFASSTSGQGGGGGGGRGNLFNMFGGGGRGGFGGFGGGGGGAAAGGAGSRSSPSSSARVVAVGDDRSNSLVVSAPSDLLTTIGEMVEKIDQPVTDETELRVFRLVNADPTELANQLSALFPDDSSTTGSSQNNMPFFMGRFGGGGNRGATTSNPSDRTKKLGKVIPVPDPRTSSLMVTASKTVMPQIAEMIAELDSRPDKKEVVMMYELQNADPQDVTQVLQDLFNRNTTRQNNNNNSSRSLLGTGNPLTTRATSTTSATGSASVSTFGTTSGASRATGN